MANIQNKFPNNITNEENKYRCIIIHVKEQKEFTSGGEELYNQVVKTGKNIVDLISGGSNSPSDKSRRMSSRSRTKKITGAQLIYGVALPLPVELTEAQSHDWGATNSVVGDIIGGIASKIPLSDSMKSGGIKAFSEMASASGMRKPLVNPGYFQDYNGTNPRDFSFSWEFVPESREEAEELMSIIYNIKKYTMPTSIVNGMALLSPFLFDITFSNDDINNIININDVVCKGYTVNYNAGGSLEFFADGIPKFISLSMEFSERSVVTADFY